MYRAAEAIQCNTCLFLLQDLWSKVIGVGANDPQSQAIHRSTFSTEVRLNTSLRQDFLYNLANANGGIAQNDIMAAVEKMCGTIASPAPFRGAYLVEEAKDCSDHPLPGCGHNGFSMRRRHPVLPANVIPNSWRTEALKLACVDLANNLDVEIAEKFYSLAKGSAHYTLNAEQVVAIRLQEKVNAPACKDCSRWAGFSHRWRLCRRASSTSAPIAAPASSSGRAVARHTSRRTQSACAKRRWEWARQRPRRGERRRRRRRG